MVKVNGSRFAAEVVRGNARVNLSQMAKPFGKRVRDWLRTDEAQEYLYAISDAQKCASADLLEVRKGGDPLEQGTWCRDYRIALRFAQWLSPEFSIKVDEAILGLLTASRGQARPAPPAGAGDQGAQAPGGLALRGRVYPKDRSAELGAFYAELRKWVLKEDEAAVAELTGVSPGHVAEVLAGRKPGYVVLCLLVEYATENRAAGRQPRIRALLPGDLSRTAARAPWEAYVESDYSTSISGLLNSPNSSSLEGISSGRGRATQVVFM